MALARVRRRNADNTATTDELDGAEGVKFQLVRNDKGTGSFALSNRHAAAATLANGTLVRFALDGDGVFPARVVSVDPTKVSANDEHQEMIEYGCEGILVDAEHDVVRPSEIQCDFVPPLDERYFNVFSGEYEIDGDWEYAVEIALQGWGSAFYTGQPAGWTDGYARYLWSTSGTIFGYGLDQNALPGRCIFKESVLVGAGAKTLDWGADNHGTLYLNGKKIQEGDDFRKKQTYEFTTTAGFLTICIDAINAEDDGPAGGNPGGVIGSLREGGPDGPVIWRTTDSMRVLPYPTEQPGMPVGEILRKCMERTTMADTWTLGWSDTTDYNGDDWPTITDISFRTYDDSILDVIRTLAETWADFYPLPSGLGLRAYVKDSAGSSPGIDLIAGYSDAGIADPTTVNVLGLEWETEPPKGDLIALRWQDAWLERGSGTRVATFRAEQIKTLADAISVADALLDLYGREQKTASFTYLPLTEPTDLPFTAFNLFDTLGVPSTGDLDTMVPQRIYSITVTANDEQEGEAEYAVQVGDPLVDEIDLLERAIKRGAPGTGKGIGAIGSPTSGTLPPSTYGKLSSPSAGSPAKVVASMPNAVNGDSESAPATFVGLVTSLRLYGVGPTGTSTVTVNDSVTTWTLTGTGAGLVDFVDIADTSWDTTTMITVTITALGHRSLHVYADVAEVNG